MLLGIKQLNYKEPDLASCFLLAVKPLPQYRAQAGRRITASSSDLDIKPREKHVETETSVAVGKEIRLQAAGVGNMIVEKLQRPNWLHTQILGREQEKCIWG